MATNAELINKLNLIDQHYTAGTILRANDLNEDFGEISKLTKALTEALGDYYKKNSESNAEISRETTYDSVVAAFQNCLSGILYKGIDAKEAALELDSNSASFAKLRIKDESNESYVKVNSNRIELNSTGITLNSTGEIYLNAGEEGIFTDKITLGDLTYLEENSIQFADGSYEISYSTDSWGEYLHLYSGAKMKFQALGAYIFENNPASPESSGVVIRSTHDFTGNDDGALSVSGGAYFEKRVFINSNAKDTPDDFPALEVFGDIKTDSDMIVNGTLCASNASISSKLTSNTISVTEIESNLSSHIISVKSSDILSIKNETQSDSSTTGALIVAGGLGIGKNLYVGGQISGDSLHIKDTSRFDHQLILNLDWAATLTEPENAGNTYSGSIVTKGGIYIQCDKDYNYYSTEDETITEASLIVDGGALIRKDLRVEKNLDVVGNINVAGNISATSYDWIKATGGFNTTFNIPTSKFKEGNSSFSTTVISRVFTCDNRMGSLLASSTGAFGILSFTAYLKYKGVAADSYSIQMIVFIPKTPGVNSCNGYDAGGAHDQNISIIISRNAQDAEIVFQFVFANRSQLVEQNTSGFNISDISFNGIQIK